MRPTKAERVCMDSPLEGSGFELPVPLLRSQSSPDKHRLTSTNLNSDAIFCMTSATAANGELKAMAGRNCGEVTAGNLTRPGCALLALLRLAAALSPPTPEAQPTPPPVFSDLFTY